MLLLRSFTKFSIGLSTHLFLLWIAHIVTAKSGQLRFLFLLVRHGERLPCHALPHPEYPKMFAANKCALTRNGSRQHYELGVYVRQHYSSLLSPEINQKQIFIRSTGTDRTLMSANFFSHGLLPPLKDGLPHMPPIYSCPKRFDELLKVSCPCPFFKRLLKNSVFSQLAVDFARQELPLFYKLKEIINFSFNQDAPHESLPQLWELCDPVFVWHHLTPSSVPSSFTADLISGCQRAVGFKQQVHFATLDQTRFKGGPLVLHLLDLFANYKHHWGRRQTRPPPTKVEDEGDNEFFFVDSALLGTDALDISVPPEALLVAYFTHDSMLAAFLSHLRIFNNILPPFSSAVIVELREHTDGELKVHFLYRNETDSNDQPPHVLIPKVCRGQTDGCPLKILEEGLRGTASTNLSSDCQLPTEVEISSSGFCSTSDTCPMQQQHLTILN